MLNLHVVREEGRLNVGRDRLTRRVKLDRRRVSGVRANHDCPEVGDFVGVYRILRAGTSCFVSNTVGSRISRGVVSVMASYAPRRRGIV